MKALRNFVFSIVFISTVVFLLSSNHPSSSASGYPDATGWMFNYLPYISGGTNLKTYLVCSQPNLTIPDNSPSGALSQINFSQIGITADINVFIKIEHTWVGDLKATVANPVGTSVTLFDQPGFPETGSGCNKDHIQAIFDDGYPITAETRCGTYPAAVAGILSPLQPLSLLNGAPASGLWTLKVSDLSASDQGRLLEWCTEITVGSNPLLPTPTPPPINLPAAADIPNIVGQTQLYSLGSEARSAVSWAGYFGVTIDETDFLNHLPVSDNPDKGFVGDPEDAWGQTPPNSYGVHADPVAALLRQYGLTASSKRTLRWQEIKAEIASGRPVIAWVTGNTRAGEYEAGAPQYYIPASDQSITVVSRFERAVIVIGYSDTTGTVKLLDGGEVYERSIEEFLTSWSMLRNMAILARP